MPSDAASALKPAAEITDHTIQSQIHTLLPISLALFFFSRVAYLQRTIASVYTGSATVVLIATVATNPKCGRQALSKASFLTLGR